jgi:hypothetical protein
MYFKVHSCVLFWKFLLKMVKCYLIRVFKISKFSKCWMNSVSNRNLNEVVGEPRPSS